MDMIGRLLQVGVVSSVDTAKRRVRVILPETGIVSDWLFVAGWRRNEAFAELPKINDRVLAAWLPVEDGDGFVLGVIE